jgi:glycine/D-amino acid oxidase-like deaminating enzyme
MTAVHDRSVSREGLRRHPVDVLVIGAGGAGLRAAMAASEAGCEVVVLSKRSRLDAHTVLASGGINAALGTRDAEDSWQQHFADTLHEGYLLGLSTGDRSEPPNKQSPPRPRMTRLGRQTWAVTATSPAECAWVARAFGHLY